MLSLTMLTAPLAARTNRSRIGPNCLHGPHHGAQKSTMTGCSKDASTTSAIKVAVVTSLTGVAAEAAPPRPPPIKPSSAMPASPEPRQARRHIHASAASLKPDSYMTRRGHASPRRRSPGSRDVDDARRVTAGIEKAHQIAGRDRGGAVVFQRMI